VLKYINVRCGIKRWGKDTKYFEDLVQNSMNFSFNLDSNMFWAVFYLLSVETPESLCSERQRYPKAVFYLLSEESLRAVRRRDPKKIHTENFTLCKSSSQLEIKL
jgi:hypothetical protein